MKKQAFTLIELLIVVAIIGILVAVLIPGLLNARKTAAKQAIKLYGKDVATVVVAWLSDQPDRTVEQAVDATKWGENCNYTSGPKTIDGLTIKKAPPGIQSCVIDVDGLDARVTIVATSVYGGETSIF